MKFVKTLVILFAFVMAFSCFHATALFAGDEHPWDEESDNGIVIPPGDDPNVSNSTSPIESPVGSEDSSDANSFMGFVQKVSIQTLILLQSLS